MAGTLLKTKMGMLRRLVQNRGQNTAEYALLIALVVAGVIAMQTYAQRTLQGRVRDASLMMRDSTNTIGNAAQYEPYYLQTNYQTSRSSTETSTQAVLASGQQITNKDVESARTRAEGGYQVSSANTTTSGGNEDMPTGI